MISCISILHKSLSHANTSVPHVVIVRTPLLHTANIRDSKMKQIPF